MLKFKENSDYDGFVGKMTDKTDILNEIYQLKASFNPGDMIFEASINYHTKTKIFTTSVSLNKIFLCFCCCILYNNNNNNIFFSFAQRKKT